MNRDELAQQIAATISTVLRCPLKPGPELSRECLPAWDSLKHIEIMMAIEEALDLQFSEEEFGELASLDAIVAAVQAHHAA